MFCKKGVLKHFAKFRGKQLCRILFFYKMQADYCRCAEKRLLHMCFPIKFARFLRTSFFKNISGRLILDMKFFQAIFYTHTRNIWDFSKKNFWKLFKNNCNNQPFLLLLPGFRKPWSQGMLINLVWWNSDCIYVFMHAFKH